MGANYQHVCLSVCLSVFRSTHISQKCTSISPNFQYTLPVDVAQSSSDGNAIMAMQYVIISGFVDDVVSQDGANGMK